jgi:hypothetical protein
MSLRDFIYDLVMSGDWFEKEPLSESQLAGTHHHHACYAILAEGDTDNLAHILHGHVGRFINIEHSRLLFVVGHMKSGLWRVYVLYDSDMVLKGYARRDLLEALNGLHEAAAVKIDELLEG